MSRSAKRRARWEESALLVLAARLDTRHPGFGASDEVRVALDSIRPYLDSWVLPLIAELAGPPVYRGHRESIERDAVSVRVRIARRQLAAEEVA